MQDPLASIWPRACLLLLIAPMMSGCLADTLDDCSLRMPTSKKVPEVSRGCADVKNMAKNIDDCVRLGRSTQSNSESKYDIDRPGHYCLTEDWHARVEFGDHPAERRIIAIWSNDVVLDLQGHTLGRGRIIKNPGGNGIEIVDRYTNIRIKNGTLQDFHTAIYHDSPKYPAVAETPIYDAKTNTYQFENAGIILENVTFKNNKENFRVRIPKGEQP